MMFQSSLGLVFSWTPDPGTKSQPCRPQSAHCHSEGTFVPLFNNTFSVLARQVLLVIGNVNWMHIRFETELFNRMRIRNGWFVLKHENIQVLWIANKFPNRNTYKLRYSAGGTERSSGIMPDFIKKTFASKFCCSQRKQCTNWKCFAKDEMDVRLALSNLDELSLILAKTRQSGSLYCIHYDDDSNFSDYMVIEEAASFPATENGSDWEVKRMWIIGPSQRTDPANKTRNLTS